MKKYLIGVSALAMFAAPAAAQTVTDIVVADSPTPNLNINASSFDNAVSSASSATQVSNTAGARSARKTAADGASTDASTILNTVEAQVDGISQGGLDFDNAGNKAGVEQDGNSNDAEVTQNGGNAGFAIVNQAGANSDARITQSNNSSGTGASKNRAYIGQVAASNESTDDNQKATVTQVYALTNGVTAANNASIQQGGVTYNTFLGTFRSNGENNNASISQTGAGNDAAIQQGAEYASNIVSLIGNIVDFAGRNNTASVVQNGSNNKAGVSQEDAGESLTTQYGQNNQAYTRQDDNAGIGVTYSRINQGTALVSVQGNFAGVNQTSINVRSEIDQLSDNNEAWVEQTELSIGSNSEIQQGQNGGAGGNFASVFQDRPNVDSQILQLGQNNEAYVRQVNAAESNSVVSQNGTGNYSFVKQ